MRPLQPFRVTASTTERKLQIPARAKVVQLYLQSAVALQIAIAEGESNIGGKFVTIPSSITSVSWDFPGNEDAGFDLWIYAGSTLNVDVLVFV